MASLVTLIHGFVVFSVYNGVLISFLAIQVGILLFVLKFTKYHVKQ